MNDLVRLHVLIAGRVQGVGFRYSCEEEAESRGLAGWVRNLPDGRVETVFEGPRGDVEEMLAWCRKGPPASRVTNVEFHWEDPRNEREFQITH
jgi:acylphosphatase